MSISFSRADALKAGAEFFKDDDDGDDEYSHEPEMEEYITIPDLAYSVQVHGDDIIHVLNMKSELTFKGFKAWLLRHKIPWDFA